MEIMHIPGYNEEHPSLDGAHLIAETSEFSAEIVARIPEPLRRAERRGTYGPGAWTGGMEADWRDAVYAEVLRLWGTKTDDGSPLVLVFDPGRDQIEEERLEAPA